MKSLNCPYCHLVHEGQRQKRIRPSKSTRQRRKAEKAGAEVPGEDGGAAAQDFDQESPELPVYQ